MSNEKHTPTLADQIALATLDVQAARLSMPTRSISPEANERLDTREAILATLNSHDALVAALDDLVRFVSPGDDDSFAAMLDEARAALKAAKGEA